MKLSTLAVALIGLTPFVSQAAPTLSDVNAIVFNTYQGQYSDAEGAVAARNMSLEGYALNSRGTSSVGAYVLESLSLTNGQINGNAWVLGQVALTGATVTGQVLTDPSLSATFASWQSYFTGQSALYGLMSNTGAVSKTPWNSLVLEGTMGLGTQVFNIQASDLAGLTGFSISGVGAGEKIVLNIFGQSASIQNIDTRQYFSQYNALFNFVDATDLYLTSASVYGEVLAPLATLHGMYGHIDGLAVVNNWQGSYELHQNSAKALDYFTVDAQGGGASTVSEPGTAALLALGLGGLSAVLRRKPA
jgi:choice-of-anchor A domain-containing protein